MENVTRLAAGIGLTVLLVAPTVMALELRSFQCTVDAFADDSRYPADDDFIRRAGMMEITIVDAGERLVLETTLPGEETERAELPVTERLPERLVGRIDGEMSEHSVTLDLKADVAGALVYRTYETDHRWRFSCSD